MKLCVSAIGFQRFTVSSVRRRRRRRRLRGRRFRREMKGKNSLAGGRRLSHRSARLVMGLLLPFLFVRAAFLVLESAALCSSPVGCVTWRLFGGSDSDLLREELLKALVEASSSTGGADNGRRLGISRLESANSGSSSGNGRNGRNLGIANSIPLSFEDLVHDMTLTKQDLKAFAFKTKAMIARVQHSVQEAKWRESLQWHLAAHGLPKSLHCLSLNLAEEYAVNSAARSRLPQPQYIYRLRDPSFHHVVLLSDNLLAVSVVVSSTIKNSRNPEKLVFHLITDKKTYPSMHAWFSINAVDLAIVEVKGLHQYGWSHEVNVLVKETLEIHHQIWSREYRSLKMAGFAPGKENDRKLDALGPGSISVLNHLRIYLPVLFPDLDKVVLLDDDVVVQRDLSSLWGLDLDQKVAGAVFDSWCGPGCCPGRKYKDYFNFMDPILSASRVNPDSCGWLYGVNVFDLARWRKTNITQVYHQWLKHSLNSGFELWHAGALPPALLAFENQVQRVDPTWHLAGLGYRQPQMDPRILEAAAVVHFSGPAKPWLEIGSPAARGLWNRHVNFSDEHVRRCGITG